MDPVSKRLLLENLFTIMGLTSVAIAVVTLGGRWLDLHYKSRAKAATPPADDARLARIEAAVEAMAIEVERIAEAQRFTTKVLTEGPVRPVAVPVPAADAAPAARSIP